MAKLLQNIQSSTFCFIFWCLFALTKSQNSENTERSTEFSIPGPAFYPGLTGLPNDAVFPTTKFEPEIEYTTTEHFVPKQPTVLKEEAPKTSFKPHNAPQRHGNGNNGRQKWIHRLAGMGSKFFFGDDRSRNFDSSDIGSAVGGYTENETTPTSDKWGLINPIQLIMDKFMVRRSKLNRLREVKDNFRRKEYERRVDFFADNSGDKMTRGIRNIIRKLVNRYEKNTETMQMLIEYRNDKLNRFLELPLVASIMGDRTNTTSQGVNAGERGDTDRRGSEEEGYRRFNPIAEISRKFMKFIGIF